MVNLSAVSQSRHSSMECWNAGRQDVSGSILANLDSGNPCQKDREVLFMLVDEGKLMNHFVMRFGIFPTVRLRPFGNVTVISLFPAADIPPVDETLKSTT